MRVYEINAEYVMTCKHYHRAWKVTLQAALLDQSVDIKV